MLQEEQNLVSKGGQLARGNLGGEIVGNLVLLAVRGPRIARAAEKEEDCFNLSAKRDGSKKSRFGLSLGLENSNYSPPRVLL